MLSPAVDPVGVDVEHVRARGFRPSDPLPDYSEIIRTEAQFFVDHGDAIRLGLRQSEFRFTLEGAFKLFGQKFSSGHFDRMFLTTRRGGNFSRCLG